MPVLWREGQPCKNQRQGIINLFSQWMQADCGKNSQRRVCAMERTSVFSSLKVKDTKDVVACVVDFGMFMPLAVKLAEQMKQVYYSTPFEKGFIELGDCVIGDGMEAIKRLDDFLSPAIIDEIDLFVFPYILHSGLQEHLEAIGKAVWGSRSADSLETMKGKFYSTLEDIGLPVPEHKVITGMTKLRDYLEQHDDLWIKISRYRGTCDTWHHANYLQSQSYLDLLAMKLGPFKEKVPFYVLKPIKTDIEGGIDSYCIDGQWPDQAVLGYEKKNETYLATVKPFKDMPEEFSVVNDAIGAVLAKYNYRNFFSTEVRVKGGKSYFIDPTCRMPSPAGEEELDLYGNMGDIIWHGAQGVLIHPEITAKFAGEALIHFTGEKAEWKSLKVPESLRNNVKLYGCAEEDGVFWWPPDEEEVIGCIVGVADSVEDVIGIIKETTDALSDNPIRVDYASFYDLIKEIKEADDQGIEFSDQEMPAPETALTNGE